MPSRQAGCNLYDESMVLLQSAESKPSTQVGYKDRVPQKQFIIILQVLISLRNVQFVFLASEADHFVATEVANNKAGFAISFGHGLCCLFKPPRVELKTELWGQVERLTCSILDCSTGETHTDEKTWICRIGCKGSTSNADISTTKLTTSSMNTSASIWGI